VIIVCHEFQKMNASVSKFFPGGPGRAASGWVRWLSRRSAGPVPR
jgi:hypothetical protein